MECYVGAVIDNMPATPQKMDNILAATAAGEKLQMVIRNIRLGWPEHVSKVLGNIRDYFPM